jgi:hypothetical protein
MAKLPASPPRPGTSSALPGAPSRPLDPDEPPEFEWWVVRVCW